MRALGDADAFPASDLGLRKAVNRDEPAPGCRNGGDGRELASGAGLCGAAAVAAGWGWVACVHADAGIVTAGFVDRFRGRLSL